MKLFNWMKEGDTYAVTVGDYVGSLLIYIEKEGKNYNFLKIPNMVNMSITKEKFDFGIEHSIIEYIERVPKYVRKTSKAQYNSNKRTEGFQSTE